MRVFRLAILLLVVAPLSFAQDASQDKAWSTTTQQQDPSGAYSSTRTSESHTQIDGRTIDKTSVEAVGLDGRYVPYQDIEKESVKVDANTVRTIERTYSTGPDGQKSLVQVREEESHKLADGGQSIVRTTSNPDVNGSLQVVQREMQNSAQTSPDVRETKTTVLTPDINGGLSPTTQIEQREQKSSDGTVQFKRSTQLSDGTGHWNLAEVREGTDKPTGNLHSIDERVLRPDSNGNLAVVEHTIKQQTESSPGEKKESVETYSVNVPGVAGDNGLQLVQRENTVVRSGPSGQTTTRKIEQPNPGAPGDSLQVTSEAIDIVRPATSGAADQKNTTLVRDSDGRLREVWVDFGKTDNPSALPEKPQLTAKPK